MMADFDKTFNRVIHLEFRDKNDALHVNEGENGLTYMGIYQSAHPNWIGWSQVKKILTDCKGDIRKASAICYEDTILYSAVGLFYDKEFFSKMRLNEVVSQQIADELFCGAINYNIRQAVKLAQRLIGATVDGGIGKQTIGLLNKYDPKKFDVEFDKLEIEFYNKLVAKKPAFNRFIKGWKNRAISV